jgi:hypothetical protein
VHIEAEEAALVALRNRRAEMVQKDRSEFSAELLER